MKLKVLGNHCMNHYPTHFSAPFLTQPFPQSVQNAERLCLASWSQQQNFPETHFHRFAVSRDCTSKILPALNIKDMKHSSQPQTPSSQEDVRH